jgi:hypothetical protein
MSTRIVRVNVGTGGLQAGSVVEMEDSPYLRSRLGDHFTDLTPTTRKQRGKTKGEGEEETNPLEMDALTFLGSLVAEKEREKFIEAIKNDDVTVEILNLDLGAVITEET